jgi:polyphosphate kinase 2
MADGTYMLEDAGPGDEIPGVDLDAPKLPHEIEAKAFTSGHYPYTEKLKRKIYKTELQALQIELLKLQRWVLAEGKRIVIIFEGLDAAGKDGCINAFMEHLNPRQARSVALQKPTDVELGQWYFQRYVNQLPSAGNMLLFDRSWYNRAAVEPVMGYCTAAQYGKFMHEVPQFESLLVEDGISLFKIWLSVGREMQIKRFFSRRHHILKRWKLNDNDVKSLGRYDAYIAARNEMLSKTDTDAAPWTVIKSNDKRRARLAAIRSVLLPFPYEGKDATAVGTPDPKIAFTGRAFLATEA